VKDLSVNGNGTITDHQLDLMWAATDNQGNITWKQADKWVRYTPFPIRYPPNIKTGVC